MFILVMSILTGQAQALHAHMLLWAVPGLENGFEKNLGFRFFKKKPIKSQKSKI